ncbi:peptidoglycan/LPS O-acetylase OafA/YrhL [Algoriphagus iocasae]|uniref:Peptidoglycan/LPS O-acetylase OafA/YrhL n=1 Tax=Algoriphagus iocasae TaxID=1836499 RepID=A0A841MLM1_9BACT|nr:acyltransferase [Algoriphagus iocasae]MBB6327773.1 peptidoglycan/LPS O-acetylase OafA/YrhL [Algoriphagus iocasae]
MTPQEKVLYYKGLNGIRAIAALSVLLSHIITGANYIYPELEIDELDIANYGVTMFFTLSGFLITSLLLTENKETGTIKLKDFYIRRILRIWPIYYLYIFVSAACLYFFLEANIIQKELLYYLTFFANVPFILSSGLMAISHLWSIGVEEQFYIFWPWFFMNTKSILTKLFVFVLAFYFLKVLALVVFKYTDSDIFYTVLKVNRFDCMGIGGIGAVLYHQKSKVVDFFTSKTVQWIVLICLAVMLLEEFRFSMLIDHQLVALITLSLILSNISLENPILNLENNFFNFIGKLSYGIYVYHKLIVLLLVPFVKFLPFPNGLKLTTLAVLSLVLTLAISYLSFHYFEKAFLKLKSKYTTIKSTSEKEVKMSS